MEPDIQRNQNLTVPEIVLVWAAGAAFLTLNAAWIGLRYLNRKSPSNRVLDWLVGAPFT